MSRLELGKWLAVNDPATKAAIERGSLGRSIRFMNALTGLNESALSDVDTVCARYLGRLKELAAGEIPPAGREGGIESAKQAGAREERERILAAVETCRPTEQPYTRRDWAIEERGKRALWGKIMKAIEGEK